MAENGKNYGTLTQVIGPSVDDGHDPWASMHFTRRPRPRRSQEKPHAPTGPVRVEQSFVCLRQSQRLADAVHGLDERVSRRRLRTYRCTSSSVRALHVWPCR